MTGRNRLIGADWAGRIRRAVVGIGVVWVGIGAAITAYFAIMGPTSDVKRGVVLVVLGVVTFLVGIAWSQVGSRRAVRARRNRRQ